MNENNQNTTIASAINLFTKEAKRKRRWTIFFKLITLAIIVLGLFIFVSSNKSSTLQSHNALIKVEGVIANDAEANSQRIIESLNNAYKNDNVKNVIIEINSPGGSPVQSDNVYQHMRLLQEKHPDIKMYAICTDMCASGGYYIAAGADTIYANKMSIVGSIGVIANGFGFVDLINKIGIERRTYTAGDNKDFLDPFLPKKAEQTKDFKKLLKQTHDVFKGIIKESRGSKLSKANEKEIFSGMPFNGIEGKKYGLIDGYMTPEQLKTKLDDLPLVNYTKPLDFFNKLSDKLSSGIYYQALNKSKMVF